MSNLYDLLACVAIVVLVLHGRIFSREYLNWRDGLVLWCETVRISYGLRRIAGACDIEAPPGELLQCLHGEHRDLLAWLSAKEPGFVDLLAYHQDSPLDELPDSLTSPGKPYWLTYAIAKTMHGILTCPACLGFWVGLAWYAIALAITQGIDDVDLLWLGQAAQWGLIVSLCSYAADRFLARDMVASSDPWPVPPAGSHTVTAPSDPEGSEGEPADPETADPETADPDNADTGPYHSMEWEPDPSPPYQGEPDSASDWQPEPDVAPHGETNPAARPGIAPQRASQQPDSPRTYSIIRQPRPQDAPAATPAISASDSASNQEPTAPATPGYKRIR